MYVAGLDLGVLPMGLCSTFRTLSISLKPLIFMCLPIKSLLRYNEWLSALYKVSITSVLFPDPDTPVTHVNTPIGNSTSIFFKLCSDAPLIEMDPLAFLRFVG